MLMKIMETQASLVTTVGSMGQDLLRLRVATMPNVPERDQLTLYKHVKHIERASFEAFCERMHDLDFKTLVVSSINKFLLFQ